MLWLKAFHLIFMVTWFAGLFYLPRLFVYHAQIDDQIGVERFKIMERKLFVIMSIGAIGTLIFGVWLLVIFPWHAAFHVGWIYVKFVLVGVLIGYHLFCGKLVNDFRRDRNRRGHVYFRWFNEIPSLLLIAIVIVVVVKPF